MIKCRGSAIARTHAQSALLNDDLRRSKRFILSTLCIFLEQFSYTSSLFILFLYLQIACKLTPLQTALLFLVLVSSFCICALLMGRVLYKRNFLTLNIFSFGTLIAGSMLFVWMPVGVNMWLLLCLVVLGVGMGVAFSSLESSLVRFVPDASATFAASLFLMVSLVGNTLGIVVTTMGYTWLLERSFLTLSKSTLIPMAQLLEKATNLSMGAVASWTPHLDRAVASIRAFALQHMMLVNVAIYTLALVLCAVFMQKERPMSAPVASPEKVSSRDIH